MKEKSINAKNLLKFNLGSAFGIMMFLVPIPQEDSFTTLLDYLKNFLKSLFGGALPYILVVMITGVQSVKTKFVIGVLSLVQIIYLTEVGTIVIKSEIPLNFWKLLILFMERTLIAIPLIVLFANFVL